jgi:hypothetical protein
MGRTPGAIKMVTPYAISLSLCLYKPEQKFRLLYVFVYLSGLSPLQFESFTVKLRNWSPGDMRN